MRAILAILTVSSQAAALDSCDLGRNEGITDGWVAATLVQPYDPTRADARTRSTWPVTAVAEKQAFVFLCSPS